MVTPGQTTKITFGPASGKKGFTPGEKIVFYDFVNGTRTTLDTGKAGAKGTVTLTAGWTDNTTADTLHELCSYGVTSKKMACYTVETDGFTTPEGSTTVTTAVPATTTTTTTPRTTVPPYGPPVAG